MIFTRVAWVIGLALFATMCWMAIDGFSPVMPFLVTSIVIVVLVAGGNVIGGRSTPGRSRARTSEPDGPESSA